MECRRSGFEVVGECRHIGEAVEHRRILRSGVVESNLEEPHRSHHGEGEGHSLEADSREAEVEHSDHHRGHEAGASEVDNDRRDRLSLVVDLLRNGNQEEGSRPHHEQMEEACQNQPWEVQSSDQE